MTPGLKLDGDTSFRTPSQSSNGASLPIASNSSAVTNRVAVLMLLCLDS